MTAQVPSNRQHIADLLPAYMNETLDLPTTEHVHKHLLYCEACQLELATWKAMRNATRLATASALVPSANMLSQVWARIDTPAEAAVPVLRWSLKRVLFHLWLVFRRQIPVMHKSIWIGSLLVMAAGCFLAIFFTRRTSDATFILTLFASVVAATGSAFIYGAENDAGLEITLSTPTSMRMVMLSRMALVVGYNIALSMLASASVIIFHGGSFWQIVQAWLGPLLLLSSIGLILSLVIGSIFAMAGALVVEIGQTLQINLGQGITLVHSNGWQTNPFMLFLAVVLIVFAVLYGPRQLKPTE